MTQGEAPTVNLQVLIRKSFFCRLYYHPTITSIISIMLHLSLETVTLDSVYSQKFRYGPMSPLHWVAVLEVRLHLEEPDGLT